MEELTSKVIRKDAEGIDEVKALYEASFPEDEQIPWDILVRDDPAHVMRAYYVDQKLIGLSYVCEFRDMAYIGYLAIVKDEQNHSYGTTILKQIETEYQNRRIVGEIEEVGDDPTGIRNRRREFYLKRGYHSAGLHYRIFGVDYEILTSKGTVTKEEWTAFAEARGSRELADRIEYF